MQGPKGDTFRYLQHHSKGDVKMFMEEIRRYSVITELDEMVLSRLINHILIGETKKVDRLDSQNGHRTRIAFNGKMCYTD